MNNPVPPANFTPTQSSVPGIEVYAPAPKAAEPRPEVVEFNCPQCGATTAFSAADGALTCSHCGYVEKPQQAAVGHSAEQFEFTTDTIEQAAQQGWGEGRKEMACQNCGALTSVPAENLTHTCPFCGSNKVIQREAPQDIMRPRFLIPFKIEPAKCVEYARHWLGSTWMVPSSLKSAASMDKFTGVYLPFWTFEALTNAGWKAEVGHIKVERYHEKGEWKERTRTEWRWEQGHVQIPFVDLLVEGTTRLSALLLGQLKNYAFRDLTAYEPQYLAGLQAQAYDVPLEKAWETGRQQMREQTRLACIGQASTSQVRNFSMTLDFAEESWRYVLLPVYINTYKYNEKVFQLMVNGQTGFVAGQRPADWTRIWLVIAALLSPGVLVGLIGLVTAALGIGIVVGAIGFVLLIIGIVLSIIILVQANKLDDA